MLELQSELEIKRNVVDKLEDSCQESRRQVKELESELDALQA